MRKVIVIEEVCDDFEVGCCYDCPFSYLDEDCYPICYLYYDYKECPLEIVGDEDE